jgi:H+/gluconate symporter-like permease
VAFAVEPGKAKPGIIGFVLAAGLFHVDLGWIIHMGLICGIPAWFASRILWGTWISQRVMVNRSAIVLAGAWLLVD